MRSNEDLFGTGDLEEKRASSQEDASFDRENDTVLSNLKSLIEDLYEKNRELQTRLAALEKNIEELPSPTLPPVPPASGQEEGVVRARPLFELSVNSFFNAHHFVMSGGVKGPSHPHSWKVEIKVEQTSLSNDQVVVGYAAMVEAIEREISRYNGVLLNNVSPFNEIIPTSENIAAFLFSRLKSTLEGIPIKLKTVTVWDRPTNSITYAERES